MKELGHQNKSPCKENTPNKRKVKGYTNWNKSLCVSIRQSGVKGNRKTRLNGKNMKINHSFWTSAQICVYKRAERYVFLYSADRVLFYSLLVGKIWRKDMHKCYFIKKLLLMFTLFSLNVCSTCSSNNNI